MTFDLNMSGGQVVAGVTLVLLLMAWPAQACWPGYVEQAAAEADMVLTAKVTHIGSHRGHGRNRVYKLVRIMMKEFLKGEDVYEDYLDTLDMDVGSEEEEEEEEVTILEDPLDFINDLSKEDSLTTDGTISVDGVTTLGTCSGRVRVGDIQIFFLRVKTKAEVRNSASDAPFLVTSQPIKVNLEVLRLTKAAVQDAPYEPRPPIQEEPCEQQFCAWGGECVTDEEGVATCACPTSCPAPSSTTSPVCGTDGNTYTTICELRRHACRTQQKTRIRHSGPCDDPSALEEGDLRTRGRDRGAARDRSTTTTTTTTTTTRSPDRN